MKKGLLLGAGFSYDFGMPITSELTEVFLDIFTKGNLGQLAKVLSAQQPFGEDRSINKQAIVSGLDLLLRYKKDSGSNYEDFLFSLQAFKGISKPSLSDQDSYNYLFSIFYQTIHTILCIYQKVSFDILYQKNRQWFDKFENLLSTKETWIFTLNHDLYLEYLALDLKLPITYGDTEYITFPVDNLDLSRKIKLTCMAANNISIDSGGYFKNKTGINLVKLHGGLSERTYNDNKLLCNLGLEKQSSQALADEFVLMNEMVYYHQGQKVSGGKDEVITSQDGTLDIISKSMLTGGKKYSNTSNFKKGEEKLKIFDDVLKDIDELTIIGYGFGDEHINFRISNGLLLNERLSVVIIDEIHRAIPSFLKQFDYNGRIKTATCGAAHWIDYSISRKWDTDQMNALKENRKYRSEIKDRVQNELKKSLYS